MREPMEKMYGAEAFAKMWVAWVDGISQFAKRSKGTEVTLFQIHDTNEVVQPLFFFFSHFLTLTGNIQIKSEKPQAYIIYVFC